jgi:putative transcriptional regulator
MNKDDFASLKRGLEQAAAYQQGAREGYAVHEPVDVKAIRAASGLTQQAFASTYHLPAGTLRDWEQHRRQPDAPARALLMLIRKDPETIAAMLVDQ